MAVDFHKGSHDGRGRRLRDHTAPALRQWSLVRVLRTVPSDCSFLTGKVSSWGPSEPMADLISYSNHSKQFLKIRNPVTCSKSVISALCLFKGLIWWMRKSNAEKVYRITAELSLGPWKTRICWPHHSAWYQGSVDQPFLPGTIHLHGGPAMSTSDQPPAWLPAMPTSDQPATCTSGQAKHTSDQSPTLVNQTLLSVTSYWH